MITKKKCISCQKSITNDTGSVEFNCPNCGEHKIIRCKQCRKIVAQYTCPKCNFVGPN